MLEVTEEDLDRLEAALRPYLRPATEPPKANGKANGTHEPPGSRLRAYAATALADERPSSAALASSIVSPLTWKRTPCGVHARRRSLGNVIRPSPAGAREEERG